MNDKSNLEEIPKICEEYLKMKKALFLAATYYAYVKPFVKILYSDSNHDLSNDKDINK